MTNLLASILVHPRFIACLNLLLVLNLFHAALEVTLIPSFNHEEAVGIIEGLGIIMIAWGVALEERHKLREVFRLIPQDPTETNYQNAIDENCHRFGLGLLLLGLFAEVGAECVHVPDRIINTSNLEGGILFLSGIFLSICGIMMIVQSVILILAKPTWLIGRYPCADRHE